MSSSDPVVLVQGGVHSSVVSSLKEKLAACGYSPKDKSFMVFLFFDWHEEWDGRPFGLNFKSDKAKDFEDTKTSIKDTSSHIMNHISETSTR